jgi:uncharacterized membrane protein YjgN (DUF898 family)
MTTTHFRFTGSGDEYFKIWIVNILLSIVTLGIYSAWATVRNRRYFYGNTWLEEANFEYHATPMQILLGRVIAIGLLVAYTFLSEAFPIIGFGLLFLIMLAAPWLILRSMQFNARMSSYRNVRFSFHGGVGDAYRYFLLIPLLPILLGALVALGLYLANIHSEYWFTSLITVSLAATYLLIPYTQALISRYHINHSQYGQGKFLTKVSAGQFYLIYLKWFGVMLLGGIVLSVLLGVVVFLIILGSGGEGLELLKEGGGGLSEENAGVLMVLLLPFIFLFYLLLILYGIFTNAYLKAQMRDYVFNQTQLDQHVQLGSNLTTWGLFKIYATNFLLIMLTMGLATPWVKVRLHRFMLEHTQAEVSGDLGQYVSQQQDLQSSLGDEMGDAFDLQGGFEVGL